MGAGIAVSFKQQFGGVAALHQQHVEVGGCGRLRRDGRYIYYLVTKPRYFNKPITQSLLSSLCAMRQLVKADGVTHLAMPHIGCGEDRLHWPTVKNMVLKVFDEVDTTLVARCLPQDSPSSVALPCVRMNGASRASESVCAPVPASVSVREPVPVSVACACAGNF